MSEAYPLYWPRGLPRTKTPAPSRFNTSLGVAVNNVQDELRRFGNDSGRSVKHVVISSNVTLMDQKPDDPGVACYFVWDGIDCCIAVDRYTKPQENLQAIAKILEAERAKIRHGGLNIVRAAMRGYASLPPPKPDAGKLAPPWREVLGLRADARPTKEDIDRLYRSKVKEHHPDRGGDPVKFNTIVEAVRQAREEIGA